MHSKSYDGDVKRFKLEWQVRDLCMKDIRGKKERSKKLKWLQE
jgi:hypothetical protein